MTDRIDIISLYRIIDKLIVDNNKKSMPLYCIMIHRKIFANTCEEINKSDFKNDIFDYIQIRRSVNDREQHKILSVNKHERFNERKNTKLKKSSLSTFG